MKIFVSLVSWDYEGDEVIGVFESRELAQAACERHKYNDGSQRGDHLKVIEYTINQDTWKDTEQ